MTGFAPLNALIFAALGLAVFWVACRVTAALGGFDVRRQVVEEKNVAAAVVAGAAILAMGWIIAAAMH